MASTPWARRDRGHRAANCKATRRHCGTRSCRRSCLVVPRSWPGSMRCWMTRRSFAPFAAHLRCPHRVGRRSPMETYLRLMFLKFRYRLGYEPLCREVSDSISWQRFCRIPLGTRVPHPTTLMKITGRCGDDAVAGLNEALLAKAAAGEAAAHRQSARRHHGRGGRCRLSDRLGAAC